MSEKEVKRCPKCGGEMEQGEFSQAHVMRHRFLKKGDFRGDGIIPFYCKNCGYIEIYKEMKQKKGMRTNKRLKSYSSRKAENTRVKVKFVVADK